MRPPEDAAFHFRNGLHDCHSCERAPTCLWFRAFDANLSKPVKIGAKLLQCELGISDRKIPVSHYNIKIK